ncbi:hypothetical protein JXQ70_03015 [bacterium]|nr:hypothetical protein [bacterium]
MNYHYVDWVYRKYDLVDRQREAYYYQTSRMIAAQCNTAGLQCQLIL